MGFVLLCTPRSNFTLDSSEVNIQLPQSMDARCAWLIYTICILLLSDRKVQNEAVRTVRLLLGCGPWENMAQFSHRLSLRRQSLNSPVRYFILHSSAFAAHRNSP